MSVAIDARWMVGQCRGMGLYAKTLIDPLADQVIALLPQNYPETSYRSVRLGQGFFPYWEQVVLPKLCRRESVERLICPYNTAPINLSRQTQLVLIVHDLIYLQPWSRLPPSVSLYQTLGRMYRKMVVPSAIRRADQLLTVSEYTRQQIVETFRIPSKDVCVIPNSIDDEWFVSEPLCRSLRKPYLLAVGGEAPSKNIPRLICAFSNFRASLPKADREIDLRVVGVSVKHHAFFMKIARASGIGEAVQFDCFLDAPSLRQLYREAWLFTMPSLYEGFGRPVLEAMASGTPVACSNTTSLPEVVGSAGWFFDPRNTEEMAETFMQAWFDTKKLDVRAKQGLARAHSYRRSAVSQEVNLFWKQGS